MANTYNISLDQLEKQAHERGLILRIQVGRPLKLWHIRIIVAQPINENKVQILGEMKAWAYASINGLQLDTLRVRNGAPYGVGDLIWAAMMTWALENTPCRKARLLAIRDIDIQHQRLIRYFRQRGFKTIKEVEAAIWDLPLRLVWGGAGSLMIGKIQDVLERSKSRWKKSK